jgi:CheY-like chemotaxis protein
MGGRMASAKSRVLVLDDSELALGAVSFILERSGYEVKTATSMLAAKSILGEWAPDVVLTDVNMPGVEERQICSWLKGLLREHDAPVVLYSGLPEEDLESLARSVGADGFLTKSKGLRHLVTELRAFCSGELSS